MRPTLSPFTANALRRAPLAWTFGLALLASVGATGLGLASVERSPASALRPWTPLDVVGVTAEPVDRDSRRALHLASGERGAVVTSTRADGLAARAGLQVGDVIERVDGGRVDGPKTLTLAVQRLGTPRLDLTIARSGHRHHIMIDRPGMGA